jgi:hypothetical protein
MFCDACANQAPNAREISGAPLPMSLLLALGATIRLFGA